MIHLVSTDGVSKVEHPSHCFMTVHYAGVKCAANRGPRPGGMMQVEKRADGGQQS